MGKKKKKGYVLTWQAQGRAAGQALPTQSLSRKISNQKQVMVGSDILACGFLDEDQLLL